jgi:hypothetical protein
VPTQPLQGASQASAEQRPLPPFNPSELVSSARHAVLQQNSRPIPNPSQQTNTALNTERSRKKRRRGSTILGPTQDKRPRRDFNIRTDEEFAKNWNVLRLWLKSERASMERLFTRMFIDPEASGFRRAFKQVFLAEDAPPWVDDLVRERLQVTNWSTVKAMLKKDLKAIIGKIHELEQANQLSKLRNWRELPLQNLLSQHVDTVLEFLSNVKELRRYAPSWLHILSSAIPDSIPTDKQNTLWIGPFIANIGAQLQPKRGGIFRRLLGMFLWHQNLTRSGMELLNRIGVSPSYDIINRAIQKVTDCHKELIRMIGQLHNVVVTYDNIQFTDRIRDKHIGEENHLFSATTAFLKLSKYIPEEGIPRNWYHYEYRLRETDIIVPSRAWDTEYATTTSQLWWHYTYNAMKVCFPELPEAPKSIEMEDSTRRFTTDLPDLGGRPEPPFETETLTLGPLMFDESTEAGNVEILRNIHEEQFGLSVDDPRWEKNMYLHVGDALTTQRIASMKSNLLPCPKPYFRADWILSVIGLWHLRYNFVKLIVEEHFGGPSDDTSTLYHVWHAVFTSKSIDKGNFEQMHQLIVNAFNSKLLGLVIEYLRYTRKSIPGLTELKQDEIAEWWKTVPLTEIEAAIRWACTKIRNSRRVDLKDPNLDYEFENNKNFLNNVFPYMVLTDAIKLGDIQLLRYAIRSLLLMFSALKSKTTYQYELCHYFWLTCTQASDEQLQDIILRESLVNRQGKQDSWYEMDRYNELINARVKQAKYSRRTSSLPFPRLLGRYLRVDDFMVRLRNGFANNFQANRDATHKVKDKSRHVWMIMVNTIARSHGEASGLTEVSGRGSITSSTDLLQTGADRLNIVVRKFNLITTIAQQGLLDNIGGGNQADIISDILDNNPSALDTLEQEAGLIMDLAQRYYSENSTAIREEDAQNSDDRYSPTGSVIRDDEETDNDVENGTNISGRERDFGDDEHQMISGPDPTDIADSYANQLGEGTDPDSGESDVSDNNTESIAYVSSEESDLGAEEAEDPIRVRRIEEDGDLPEPLTDHEHFSTSDSDDGGNIQP